MNANYCMEIMGVRDKYLMSKKQVPMEKVRCPWVSFTLPPHARARAPSQTIVSLSASYLQNKNRQPPQSCRDGEVNEVPLPQLTLRQGCKLIII